MLHQHVSLCYQLFEVAYVLAVGACIRSLALPHVLQSLLALLGEL